MKIFRILAGIAVGLLLVAALAGCGEPETVEATPEPEYAGEATDITLQGLSENDLNNYTRYGNADFKAAVTQEVLDKAASQVTGQLGAYESKEFLYAEEQGEYTLIHYTARFEKGEVGVKMVFDTDHLVAGQWFE